jgi:hypothetical protein
MLGGLAVLALLGYGAYALLVPPTSGPGWRLDPDATWGMPAIPDGIRPSVVIYAATESELGFGLTVFGSSSCPPQLRSVVVGSGALRVDTWRGLAGFGGCTADAAAHAFGIVVERDRLGAPPISVIVSGGDWEPVTIVFEDLP